MRARKISLHSLLGIASRSNRNISALGKQVIELGAQIVIHLMIFKQGPVQIGCKQFNHTKNLFPFSSALYLKTQNIFEQFLK
jgi:hypothetical protein